MLRCDIERGDSTAASLSDLFVVRMFAEHCSADLTPLHEGRRLGRRFRAREDCFLVKQEYVNQVRDHRSVMLIVCFAVLLWVAIHIGLNHPITVASGSETHYVNTEAGPTRVEEEAIFLPVR